MMRNKLFITFEGIEGAGKSTLINTLCAHLDKTGVSYVRTREPGGCELAERIRSLLLDKQFTGMSAVAECLLMYAARAEHVEKIIRPALARGQWVICDRFYDASFAYQAAGRGLPPEMLSSLTDWSVAETIPDYTFLLDLPVATGLSRAAVRNEQDRIEEESVLFFEKVRQAYLERANDEPERMICLDATLSPEALFNVLMEKLPEMRS